MGSGSRAVPTGGARARVDDPIASQRARRTGPHGPSARPEPAFGGWVREVLLASPGVSVAVSDGEVIGLIATSRSEDASWIDQLYLSPDAVGRGVGTRMLRAALESLPAPVRLRTFRQNAGARRFYERHGFEPVRRSDGHDNEERCPDVLYERRRTAGDTPS